MVEPDGLHILSADVEHEGRIGNACARGAGVRDRLDRMVVGVERAREKLLAVSRGAHGIDRKRDSRCLPAVLQADKTLLGDVDRSAVIRRVERIDKLTRLIDQGELGRRAPRIDTERHTHRLSGRIRIRTLCRRLFAMACRKIRLLGRCGKKGLGKTSLPACGRDRLELIQPDKSVGKVDRLGRCEHVGQRQGGTARDHDLRIARDDNLIVR